MDKFHLGSLSLSLFHGRFSFGVEYERGSKWAPFERCRRGERERPDAQTSTEARWGAFGRFAGFYMSSSRLPSSSSSLLLLLFLFPALVKLIKSLFISAVSRLSRERDPLLNSNRVVLQHDVLGNDDDWTVGLAVNIDSNSSSSVFMYAPVEAIFQSRGDR